MKSVNMLQWSVFQKTIAKTSINSSNKINLIPLRMVLRRQYLCFFTIFLVLTAISSVAADAGSVAQERLTSFLGNGLVIGNSSSATTTLNEVTLYTWRPNLIFLAIGYRFEWKFVWSEYRISNCRDSSHQYRLSWWTHRRNWEFWIVKRAKKEPRKSHD